MLRVDTEIWISRSYPGDNNNFLIARPMDSFVVASRIFEDSWSVAYKGGKRKWMAFESLGNAYNKQSDSKIRIRCKQHQLYWNF